MTKQNIDQKIIRAKKILEDLEAKKKQLEEADKLKDFQSIKYKGKEYRIYKWEDKPFKDFQVPKGFKWCPYIEFIELVNNTDFVWEKYPIFYYSWSPFDLNHKNKSWELSGAYLDNAGYWVSDIDYLAYSDDYGRVVICEVDK